MSLGERLKKARESRGLTQIQLGKMVNVSDATINRYERGQRKPTPEMLSKLAEILHVSVDYLVDGPGETAYESATLAAHRTDDPLQELPEEAKRSLQEFQEYILRKYGVKKD
ncbi:MAG: helix-turn-helix domain-containing protein [Desulfurispora sp.]|uniref:helix-turn-helix domain-containing protein n=1 Tax=Desulfurispora sp. TaxID=3014275 RepID=UPI0040490AEB